MKQTMRPAMASHLLLLLLLLHLLPSPSLLSVTAICVPRNASTRKLHSSPQPQSSPLQPPAQAQKPPKQSQSSPSDESSPDYEPSSSDGSSPRSQMPASQLPRQSETPLSDQSSSQSPSSLADRSQSSPSDESSLSSTSDTLPSQPPAEADMPSSDEPSSSDQSQSSSSDESSPESEMPPSEASQTPRSRPALESQSPSLQSEGAAGSGNSNQKRKSGVRGAPPLSDKVKKAMNTICSKTKYPGLCVQSITPLLSSVQSDNLDAAAFLEVQIKDVRSKAKQATHKVNKLLKKPHLGKRLVGILGVCSDIYEDVFDNLDKAIKAVEADDKDTTKVLISAVIDDIQTCDDAFAESQLKSPIEAIDGTLSKVVSNCLAIAYEIK